jgi:antitoxin component of MazEF toxin-antitoxin module
MRMKTKIQKWGNSLAVRIPKVLVRERMLRRGMSVLLKGDGEHIVIIPKAEATKRAKVDWRDFVIPKTGKEKTVASKRVDDIVYGASYR